MTMQKHVLAAMMLLACTTNAGRAGGKARRGLEDAVVEQDLGNDITDDAPYEGVAGDAAGAASDLARFFEQQGAGDLPPDAAANVEVVGGDLSGSQADMATITGEREWTVDGVEIREKKSVSKKASALRRLETLEDGEWKDGVKCTGGVLEHAWIQGQREPMETVELAKMECAAACDANDLCANANLFYGPYNGVQGSTACSLRTDECGGEYEHPRYYTYSKGATTSPPTCKWQTGVRCSYGYLALGYDGPFDWTEERAKAECAALCIQNDDCAYADLYYTSSTKSCSLMTDECADHGLKQNSNWRMYSKYGTCHPDIEVAPVPEPTPAPTPLAESAGGCECKNLINENGLGNCQKEYEFLGNRKICYVQLPSTCTDLQESATNVGEFYSAEACYSGDWIADAKCSSAPEHRTLVFNKWSDEQTEQQYKTECQSACDEEGSCVAAEFYYTTAPTVARCWQLDECEIAGQFHPYQLYVKGGVPEATDAPTDMPTPAPTDVPTSAPTDKPTSAPTDADSEEGCENLTVRKNMLVSIKKGKKQKKTMKLEDDSKEDVCECAELCKNAGYDIFQYYSFVKRGKVKTSCKCMNVTNKVKAKTKKGYTAGALSPAAEEAFSKFKVKTSKKDQKAGQ